MSGVKLPPALAITEQTVLSILEDEATRSTREAISEFAAALNTAAPVGPTGQLSKSHRPSVRKTPFGVKGTVRRSGKAWYGRIVEKGRKPGVSFRSGKAHRYPGAKANPFVDKTFEALEARHEAILLSGGERAAERIAQRL